MHRLYLPNWSLTQITLTLNLLKISQLQTQARLLDNECFRIPPAQLPKCSDNHVAICPQKLWFHHYSRLAVGRCKLIRMKFNESMGQVMNNK